MIFCLFLFLFFKNSVFFACETPTRHPRYWSKQPKLCLLIEAVDNEPENGAAARRTTNKRYRSKQAVTIPNTVQLFLELIYLDFDRIVFSYCCRMERFIWVWSGFFLINTKVRHTREHATR